MAVQPLVRRNAQERGSSRLRRRALRASASFRACRRAARKEGLSIAREIGHFCLRQPVFDGRKRPPIASQNGHFGYASGAFDARQKHQMRALRAQFRHDPGRPLPTQPLKPRHFLFDRQRAPTLGASLPTQPTPKWVKSSSLGQRPKSRSAVQIAALKGRDNPPRNRPDVPSLWRIAHRAGRVIPLFRLSEADLDLGLADMLAAIAVILLAGLRHIDRSRLGRRLQLRLRRTSQERAQQKSANPHQRPNAMTDHVIRPVPRG